MSKHSIYTLYPALLYSSNLAIIVRIYHDARSSQCQMSKARIHVELSFSTSIGVWEQCSLIEYGASISRYIGLQYKKIRLSTNKMNESGIGVTVVKITDRHFSAGKPLFCWSHSPWPNIPNTHRMNKTKRAAARTNMLHHKYSKF